MSAVVLPVSDTGLNAQELTWGLKQDIIKYSQDRFSPLEALDWFQVESLLHAGLDPRFCGTTNDAENNINNGIMGDALALFESFPHLVWELQHSKTISIHDNFPTTRTSSRHVHVNLEFVLREYAASLGQGRESQDRAWAVVKLCFDRNGFTDSAKAAISHEVCRSMTAYVNSVTGTSNEAAMVVVRADRTVSCLDQSNYGLFGKRGRRWLDASLFSRQIWTAYFAEDRSTKVKRPFMPWSTWRQWDLRQSTACRPSRGPRRPISLSWARRFSCDAPLSPRT